MLRLIVASIAGAAMLAAATGASAAVLVFQVTLSGPNESPPVASGGTGAGFITFDTVANTMTISDNFTGLTSGTTASHIHCCTITPLTGTAGVATQLPSFVGFPLGVTSGTFTGTFDLTQASTYNPAFVTANGGTPAGAEAALIAGASSGRAYLNIHTTQNPGGEIRGFLTPVPEPATWASLVLGFGALGVLLRRRRALALA